MLPRVCGLLLILVATLPAQPTIFANGMVNAASSIPAGLPSGNVAQGSMFSIYGQNMGPAQSPPLSWPLHSSDGLGGVTVQVKDSANQTRFAIPLFVSPGQINAVLPSATATGTATITVTYNGQTSAPQTFTVTRSSVGLLAWNQRGSGPGVVQIYRGSNAPFFSDIGNSAIAGDVGVLWGTGLGPVTFDETQPPIQGDLGVNPEVWVGGTRVNGVQYAGRSTAAGQDQINFPVPNVTGCYVPVFVKIGNVVSNTVTMSINATAGVCSDNYSFSGLDANNLRANGLREGILSLLETASKTSMGGTSLDFVSDTAGGQFFKYSWDQLTQSRGGTGVTVLGACSVITWRGDNPNTADPITPTYLDAGNISMVGPDGVTKPFTMSSTGNYSVSLGSTGIVGLPGGGQLYYGQGRYTVTATGGVNVGPFSTSITIPAAFEWSNANNINDVTRSAGQLITWTNGAGLVTISGYSAISSPQNAGAYFVCLADAARQSFTIPAEVLLALPASGTSGGVPLGFLSVADQPASAQFTATGLDVGSISYNTSLQKTVTYH